METLLVAAFVVIIAGLAIRLVSHNNKAKESVPTVAPTAAPTPAETVKEIAATAEVVAVEQKPAKAKKAPAKARTSAKTKAPKVPKPKTPKSKKSA